MPTARHSIRTSLLHATRRRPPNDATPAGTVKQVLLETKFPCLPVEHSSRHVYQLCLQVIFDTETVTAGISGQAKAMPEI